jgi:hypothetical protein
MKTRSLDKIIVFSRLINEVTLVCVPLVVSCLELWQPFFHEGAMPSVANLYNKKGRMGG